MSEVKSCPMCKQATNHYAREHAEEQLRAKVARVVALAQTWHAEEQLRACRAELESAKAELARRAAKEGT